MDWREFDFFKTGGWKHVKKTLDRCSFIPKPAHVFQAFHETPFPKVKVVILGRGPYPYPILACGLAFSVPKLANGLPPSLHNIFTEYTRDLHYPRPTSGDLTPWAQSGVLLLNTSLTCVPFQSDSHHDIGWKPLIVEVLERLSDDRGGLSFLLWGSHAQEYEQYVLNAEAHQILKAPHPDPMSASKGFFGTRPFSTVNTFQEEAVDWRLP